MVTVAGVVAVIAVVPVAAVGSAVALPLWVSALLARQFSHFLEGGGHGYTYAVKLILDFACLAVVAFGKLSASLLHGAVAPLIPGVAEHVTEDA